MTKRSEAGDPLDAMLPGHDPNATGRVRTTEPQTVTDTDAAGNERTRTLAPGTSVRVSADEAVKAAGDPNAIANYGQTDAIREAQDAARAEREAAGPYADASGGGSKRRKKSEE